MILYGPATVKQQGHRGTLDSPPTSVTAYLADWRHTSLER
jgi:hypothetical protein